jgi:Coenzyme PQQ synthesis protein D (PqqD)
VSSGLEGGPDVNLKTSRVEPIVIEASTQAHASQKPKRRSNLKYRTIEGETIILNREEGQLLQLIGTASFIWDCCDGNSNISEIIDRLAGAYEVDSSTARNDVEEVLSKLRNSRLLEAN